MATQTTDNIKTRWNLKLGLWALKGLSAGIKNADFYQILIIKIVRSFLFQYGSSWEWFLFEYCNFLKWVFKNDNNCKYCILLNRWNWYINSVRQASTWFMKNRLVRMPPSGHSVAIVPELSQVAISLMDFIFLWSPTSGSGFVRFWMNKREVNTILSSEDIEIRHKTIWHTQKQYCTGITHGYGFESLSTAA